MYVCMYVLQSACYLIGALGGMYLSHVEFTSIIVHTFHIVLLASKPISQPPDNLLAPRDNMPTQPRPSPEANQRARLRHAVSTVIMHAHEGPHIPMATQLTYVTPYKYGVIQRQSIIPNAIMKTVHLLHYKCNGLRCTHILPPQHERALNKE